MTDSLHCAQDFTKFTPKSYKLKIQIKTFWDSCDASLLKKSPNIVNKSLGSHLLSRQTWAGRDEASEAERGRWRFRGTTEKGFSEIEKSDAWRQRRKWLCAKSKRWSTLFADVCSCCASLHVPACQHSIICEKNWWWNRLPYHCWVTAYRCHTQQIRTHFAVQLPPWVSQGWNTSTRFQLKLYRWFRQSHPSERHN